MKRNPFLLLLPLALFWAACDSGDSGPDIDDVVGEYGFIEYRFLPDSPLLEPVDMTDTLVVAETRLQLFTSGRFTLLYRFEGSPSATFVGGDAERTSRGVKLKGESDDEDAYLDLLLPVEIELSTGTTPGRLSANIDRRVNLSAFSDRYAGLPSVEGTLILSLQRN
ncbi:MAG: hypothetical protein HKN29_00320 [Rhodothermales bacterium]|nr:hypothetical protein [Rhodothermales bacterium]